MGTRCLIGVRKNNKWKVAQYCQFDGYPTGQGGEILKFLNDVDFDVFSNKIDNCVFLTNNQIEQFYYDIGINLSEKTMITYEENEKVIKAHPTLDRCLGADVLPMIMKSNAKSPVELVDSHSFMDDDLFCEFAYVINVDSYELLCYCNGKKLWAKYSLFSLPSPTQMNDDYRKFCGFV